MQGRILNILSHYEEHEKINNIKLASCHKVLLHFLAIEVELTNWACHCKDDCININLALISKREEKLCNSSKIPKEEKSKILNG